MAKSTFLGALRSELDQIGEPITIGGQPFLVVPGSSSLWRELFQTATQEVEKNLFKGLKSKKLSADEKKEIKEALEAYDTEQAGDLLEKIKTEYDKERLLQSLQLAGRWYLLEIVRNPDGTKVYKSEAEKLEAIQVFSAIPGLADKVKEALVIAEKKSRQPEETGPTS